MKRGFRQSGLIVLLTLVVYLPALKAGFIWDDDDYIINNPTLRSLEGLGDIWAKIGAVPQYYPLVFTTFWIEYQLWHLHPTGYHFVNILLHSINALLLWRILNRLSIPGAWAAAAVFALHPVHVESVAWITERKNMLSGFFYLSSLLFYLRFAGIECSKTSRGNPARSRSGNWTFYILSLLCFLFALWSKTISCTLPAVILLLLWWKRDGIDGKDLKLMAPFFAAGLGMAWITVWMEQFHVGAQGEVWDFTFLERFLIAGHSLWFYLGKLLWPAPLMFNYPRWSIETGMDHLILYPFSFLAVLSALWLLRKKTGKGPLAALLFFAGTLFPALGFFNIYPMRFSFVADHFQYLASIGPITLFTALLAGAHANPDSIFVGHPGEVLYKFKNILMAALLLCLGTLTWNQSLIYKDLETLWRDTLKKNPSSWLAYNNLGAFLLSQGNSEEAIEHFKRALVLYPDYIEAHNNLGLALAAEGNLDAAKEHYLEALRLYSGNYEALNNLGAVLTLQGKFDEAIDRLTLAVKLKDDFARAHSNLGFAWSGKGKYKEALIHYNLALQLDPNSADTHNNMGIALANSGRLKEARAHFTTALRLNPDHLKAKQNLEAIR